MTEHSYFRKLCDFVTGVGCSTPGLPKDTNDNAADFLLADTVGTMFGANQRLGAPGPENLASPLKRDATVTVTLLDNTAAAAANPNRMRDVTPGAPPQTFGTISIRRRIVNGTGGNVTRLRFRVVEITTLQSPSVPLQADVRAITSGMLNVTVNDSATCLASTGSRDYALSGDGTGDDPGAATDASNGWGHKLDAVIRDDHIGDAFG